MPSRSRGRASFMLIAALMCAACTQAPSASSSRTSSPGTGDHLRTATIASQPQATCPEVTGQSEAADGRLTAGPFWGQETGTTKQAKVWVSSTRPGQDDAHIDVTTPGGATKTITRAGGEASIPTAAQFWPGLIEVPEPGLYQITIRAGPDSMCVRVRYSNVS